jgi:hypothetical protein
MADHEHLERHLDVLARRVDALLKAIGALIDAHVADGTAEGEMRVSDAVRYLRRAMLAAGQAPGTIGPGPSVEGDLG